MNDQQNRGQPQPQLTHEVRTALRVASRLDADGDHGAIEAEAIREVVRRYQQVSEAWSLLHAENQELREQQRK